MKFIQTLKNIWTIQELRQRLTITVLLVLVYRLGCYVVLPGINPNDLDALTSFTNRSGLMQLLDMFSGGAFSQASIFALGIMPYITASIVIQLAGMVLPSFQKMQREGESGRQKLNQYTRYLTVLILFVQGPAYLYNLRAQVVNAGGTVEMGLWTVVFLTIILAAGSMFIMWLGERITDRGIGNGISFIILVGIIARLPIALFYEFTSRLPGSNGSEGGLIMFIVEIVLLFAVTIGAVLLVQGTRKVPVQYAKRIVGNKQYGGARQYIPLKVNAAGVMPIIFASSFMTIPMMIFQFTGQDNQAFANYMTFCYPGTTGSQWQWVGWVFYYLVMLGLIIFFAYFYAQIQFNPQDVARNLQQYGGSIQGIRSGKPTSDYLQKINNRIVLFGALFLGFIAIIPAALFQLIGGGLGLNNAISSTGMLIAVSVALEFNKQLEGQLMMKHYKGFLK